MESDRYRESEQKFEVKSNLEKRKKKVMCLYDLLRQWRLVRTVFSFHILFLFLNWKIPWELQTISRFCLEFFLFKNNFEFSFGGVRVLRSVYFTSTFPPLDYESTVSRMYQRFDLYRGSLGNSYYVPVVIGSLLKYKYNVQNVGFWRWEINIGWCDYD